MSVVIVGLPGSGKSTLSKQYLSTHIIYDDFLDRLINGKLIQDINNGVKVCINDARLCDPKIFNRVIPSLFPDGNVTLISFDNTPDKCMENIESRGNRERWIYTIERLSKVYNPDLYDIYTNKHIPVYSKDGV